MADSRRRNLDFLLGVRRGNAGVGRLSRLGAACRGAVRSLRSVCDSVAVERGSENKSAADIWRRATAVTGLAERIRAADQPDSAANRSAFAGSPDAGAM